MAKNEEDNYLPNYQYLHFQEDPNDVFKTADIKRKCLAQTFIACNSLTNETTRCGILRKNLREYSDLVDDQNGINNYAAGIEALTANLPQMDCLQWENKLTMSDVEDTVKSLQCCTFNDVTDEGLELLFKKPPKPEIINKTPEPELINKVSEPESSNKILEPVASTSKRKTMERKKMELDSEESSSEERIVCEGFRTAREELDIQNASKYRKVEKRPFFSYVGQKRSLGIRRGVRRKFIPPYRTNINEDEQLFSSENRQNSEEVIDERLKNIDPQMIERIRSEIMDTSEPITWDDIAGLEFAKKTITEVIVWPLLRPDIFTGLRRPPKGVLLFGPPGTGKTLIGKCVASQSNSTFFNISSSSLTSKWIGEGEKMVRALFAVARCHQPAVIFIDEIDSLLCQRSDSEHESSRRMKTEFLVHLDGAATGQNDRLLIIGATNRPQELDEAVRRRFVKRLYIPLPDKSARFQIIKRLINTEKHTLTDEDIEQIAELSDGYSGADMNSLCSEASLGPIRSIDVTMIQNIQPDQVRPIVMDDFQTALKRVRPTVSPSDLNQYISWDQQYGAGAW